MIVTIEELRVQPEEDDDERESPSTATYEG